MRRTARNWLITLSLGAALLMASPTQASLEDSFQDCSYPKTFDLMVMRPMGFATMAFGTLLFLPVGPIAALTVREEASTAFDNLIGKPTRFTFGRELGECQSIEPGY